MTYNCILITKKRDNMKKNLGNKVSSASHMVCRIEKNDIALERPFKYFLDTLESLPYSKITITDNSGVEGQGEIVHASDVNGEIQGGVIYFEPIINYLLSNFRSVSSLDEIKNVMKFLRLSIIHNTGLMCGIEQALFRILSQKTGKNLIELLGGPKNEKIFIQTTIPMEKTLALYKRRVDMIIDKHHPKFVKFKVGINPNLELKAIRYFRKLDNEASISIDANQAFTSFNDALDFLNKISDINISWAEQLLEKDDLEGMNILRTCTNVPLMADESLHTPLEAEYFCQNNLVDFFNIKLAKTGGILKALDIIKIAENFGKKVMLGSMLHGKLGIEYNLGFALTQKFVTNDFFSYFNVIETKELNYICNDLSVSSKNLFN